MQPFDVCCPECQATLRVSIAELVGRKVRCPECRTPFLVVRPAATQQIGSGVLIGAGSGVGVYESSIGWAEPPEEANVLEEESPEENDDVLSGEESATYSEPEEAEVDEVAEVAEVEDGEEVAEVQYSAEDDEAGDDEDADDESDDEDSISVESDYQTSSSSHGSYSRPRGAGLDQQQVFMIGGAIAAGLLLCVTAYFVLGSSGSSSRGRSRTGKVERRDPRAFQELARQAERQGW